MNISIPHSWLKEYLKTSAGSEKIGELLSLCGPSVEKIRSVAGDAIYDIEVTNQDGKLIALFRGRSSRIKGSIFESGNNS